MALPAIESAGSLFGPTASGASGVVNAESTVMVNGSWVKNNEAQARYYREQLSAASRGRREKSRRQAATAGILQSMAAIDDDPQLADLAFWVEAGGDPQFALGYALTKDRDDAARGEAARMLERMSQQENDPELYELASWVRAGGDEKFALNYALTQSVKARSSSMAPRLAERPPGFVTTARMVEGDGPSRQSALKPIGSEATEAAPLHDKKLRR